MPHFVVKIELIAKTCLQFVMYEDTILNLYLFYPIGLSKKYVIISRLIHNRSIVLF